MADLNLSGKVILLVDDVPFAREVARTILFGMNQPEMLEASNGMEALKVLDSSPSVSFVIADFDMPVSNGLHLLKAIRTGQSQAKRSLPVALLTGFSDQHLLEVALALDVNAFVIKPISKEKISKRLERMLAQTDDTSWLRSETSYAAVSIPDAAGDRASPEPKPTEEEETPEPPQAVARRRRKVPPSPKFSDADLATEKLSARNRQALIGRFRESDLAESPLVKRLAGLAGRFEESDLAGDIALGVQQLTMRGGSAVARRVVSAFDDLQQRGDVSLEEAASVLSAPGSPSAKVAIDPRPQGDRRAATAEAAVPGPGEQFCALDEIPDGAILARDLHTADGNLLVADGTPLADEVIYIITHLKDMNLLTLHASTQAPSGTRGIFVRFSGALDAGGAEMISVAIVNVQQGTVLARDLYLRNGQFYMAAGTAITSRITALLRDLEELGHVEPTIWVLS